MAVLVVTSDPLPVFPEKDGVSITTIGTSSPNTFHADINQWFDQHTDDEKLVFVNVDIFFKKYVTFSFFGEQEPPTRLNQKDILQRSTTRHRQIGKKAIQQAMTVKPKDIVRAFTEDRPHTTLKLFSGKKIPITTREDAESWNKTLHKQVVQNLLCDMTQSEIAKPRNLVQHINSWIDALMHPSRMYNFFSGRMQTIPFWLREKKMMFP